ncbi:MAG: SDR family NAD(P)-dependent oxidoreductase [Gaiella sp.]|nr:SDR family NAD(P)-dependent oxidoreductase [Gaiella sp.]
MRDALGAVQRVLVVGGRSEIAKALVERLHRDRPVDVVLGVRDPRGPGELSFDALDRSSHGAFVEAAFAKGDIDVVLVAAGILGDQPVAERDAAAALAVIETNFVGAVSVLIPIAERLRAQGHGTIVVLSSVAAERARRANFVYGSSKAGLDAFAQGLGDSLAGTGIDVLVVRPGFVRTKMTAALPDGPLATTPEAVAEEIVRGLQRRAHTVWAPARLRFVMAVVRLLPRPLFRRLRM